MVNAKKHQQLCKKNSLGEKIVQKYYDFFNYIVNLYWRWNSNQDLLPYEAEKFALNIFMPFVYFLEPQSFEKKKWFNLVTIDDLDICYELYNYIRNFLLSKGIKVIFFDLSDSMFDNIFYRFQIFKEIKEYDVALFYNTTYEIYDFFLNYGLEECISSVLFFWDVKECKEILQPNHELFNCMKLDLTSQTVDLFYNEKHFLFQKHDKIGFDLYDNLREWKKEVTAPTRKDPEYRKMKKRVRQRDNNTCQCCGYYSDKKVHHNLEVHHIYGYKDHLDYRTEDSNCVVLCKDCHKQYHSIYGKKNVNPVTFMQFIRDYNDFHENKQTTLDEVIK